MTDIETIRKHCTELKLQSLRNQLDSLIKRAESEKWNTHEIIQNMLEAEITARHNKRKQLKIKKAGFPQKKYLAELERDELPVNARLVLPELETLEFIKDGRNVVLSGNPGTGKTHIAIGLGIKACLEGYSVLFTSVAHLLTEIRECKAEKRLYKYEQMFKKYDLVICDEFGYVSCDKEGGELLFNHLSLLAGEKSTIITTNLAFNQWSEIFQEKVMVTAMIDRLTHKAYIVNMVGESYRFKETKKLMNTSVDPELENSLK